MFDNYRGRRMVGGGGVGKGMYKGRFLNFCIELFDEYRGRRRVGGGGVG